MNHAKATISVFDVLDLDVLDDDDDDDDDDTNLQTILDPFFETPPLFKDYVEILEISPCPQIHLPPRSSPPKRYLHWSETETRHDRLSSPFSYSGSTSVLMQSIEDKLHIVVYGWPNNPTPRINNSSKKQQDCLFVFDIEESKWFVPPKPPSSGRIPIERYDHCSTTLPHRKLWTFGGRTKCGGGRCLNDLHIWSFDTGRWISVECKAIKPLPRYDSCAAFVLGNVILFGGKDERMRVLGDVWVWNLDTGVWSEMVLTGVPPPVLGDGHGMVGLGDGKIIIWSKWERNNNHSVTSKKSAVISASREVGFSMTDTGSVENVKNRNTVFGIEPRQFHVPKMDSDNTRPSIVTVLDAHEQVWRSISIPSSCFEIGKNHSVSLSNAHYNSLVTVSFDGCVQIIHVDRWTWSIPAVESTFDKSFAKIQAVKPSIWKNKQFLQIKRKAIKCNETKRILLACEQTLETLYSNHRLRNDYRFSRMYCHAAVKIGPQFYLFGEMDCDYQDVDVLMLLHLELPGECERRQNEELYARLENERLARQHEHIKKLKEMERQKFMQREFQKRKEAAERKKMSLEDELGHLPRKTFAPAVQLKLATKRMICVEWPRVMFNSQGLPVEEHDVEYRLMVKGGFVDFRKGMTVLVKQEYDGTFVPAEYHVRERAIISKRHSSFLFDLLYEDGKQESFVERQRISPHKSKWNLVFTGKGEYEYAYEAIPPFILEQERDIVVSVKFVLLTIGTEVPLHEPSLPSPVRKFSTSNHHDQNTNDSQPNTRPDANQRGVNKLWEGEETVLDSFGLGKIFF